MTRQRVIVSIALAALAIGVLLIEPNASSLLHAFHAHPLAFGLGLGLGIPLIIFLTKKHLQVPPYKPVLNCITLATLKSICDKGPIFTVEFDSTRSKFLLTISNYTDATFIINSIKFIFLPEDNEVTQTSDNTIEIFINNMSTIQQALPL